MGNTDTPRGIALKGLGKKEKEESQAKEGKEYTKLTKTKTVSMVMEEVCQTTRK